MALSLPRKPEAFGLVKTALVGKTTSGTLRLEIAEAQR